MGRIFLVSGICLFTSMRLFGQVNLYISKQTGEHSIFTGSQSKTTDQHESGSVSISTSGPIQWSLIPYQFSIGPNETKTWYGTVWGDVAAGPAPGQSVPASITGNYQVTYSRPTNNNSTGHEIVNTNGTESVSFIVHSVNVESTDSVLLCPDQEKVLHSVGYPAGGTYSWVSGNGVTITAGANTSEPTIKCAVPGLSTARVTYMIGGVSYSRTVLVKCMEPSLTLSCGDTLQVGIDERFQIRATVRPFGGVQWSVSSGLQLNSSPYNIVAFLAAAQGGWQTVTATAAVCNRQITKTVRVYVNPCILRVPDSIMVLLNAIVPVTAYANVNGSFAWTAGNGVQIQAAANQAAIDIKGTAVGTGWAQVNFTGATCNLTKRVKVIVMRQPTIRIYCAFGSISPLCKTERRILTGEGLPSGGTYSWSIGGTAIGWYGPAGNTPNPVIEALAGGNGTVTCAYTVQGQTVTATANITVREYSRVEVTARPAGAEVNEGATVTYTAVAYDHTGAVANPQPAFHWKVVYIPIGQEDNVGNWDSRDLQGGGATQTYTWGFPQGTYPLPGGGPPYKMRAWIEAAEYCTYRSGSVHINVVRNR
jgi:hypothetical protein